MQGPKVLHINTEATWRGGERQMALLIEGLKARGLTSYLACHKGGVFYERLAPLHPHIALPLRGPGILFAPGRIAAYCQKEGIELLDAHSARAHSVALLVKRRLPHLKVVVHRRVDNIPSRSFLTKLKYLSPGVDRFVAISDTIAQILREYGVAPERVTTVRSAVPELAPGASRNALRSKLKAELGWEEDFPIIANTAYLTPQKGHEVLVAALGLLKAQGARFYAFIAGDGPLRAETEAQAKALGLTELIFLGVRSDPLDLLRASDIFAMPSHNEGLGTSILDALEADLAVAATRVGGIPEIIQHERTGLLAPKGDAEAHAEHLGRLINDIDLRKSLAAAGKANLRKAFSVPQMVEGNLSIYRTLTDL